MNITTEFQEFIKQGIQSGYYESEQDALEKALEHEKAEYQRYCDHMRAEIEEGMKGPFTPGDMDSIIAEAKAERAAKRAASE